MPVTAVSLCGSGLGAPLMGMWGVRALALGRAHPESQDGGIHGFPGSRSLDLPTGLSLTLLQGKLLGVGFDKLEPFGGWVVMLIRDWDTWASARKA